MRKVWGVRSGAQGHKDTRTQGRKDTQTPQHPRGHFDLFKMVNFRQAPVAQMDRVPPSEGGSRTFESCRARHIKGLASTGSLKQNRLESAVDNSVFVFALVLGTSKNRRKRGTLAVTGLANAGHVPIVRRRI